MRSHTLFVNTTSLRITLARKSSQNQVGKVFYTNKIVWYFICISLAFFAFAQE